jgi:hypothetical protein
VTALVTLCNRFVGYGVDCKVPEQAAALEALASIGGPDASRPVGQLVAKGIVQGPTLAVAASAAHLAAIASARDAISWRRRLNCSATFIARSRPPPHAPGTNGPRGGARSLETPLEE